MTPQTTTPSQTTTPGQPSASTGDLVHTANPEYPLLMYNAQTRQEKAAKDKEDEQKLLQQGFTETPFPPQPFNPADLQELQQLITKASEALVLMLGKLEQLSQQQAQAQQQQQASQQQQAQQTPPATQQQQPATQQQQWPGWQQAG
jgi:hypothetical protein